MSPPTVLGDCTILQRIGTGAASAIYRASERSSGRIVAVKHVVVEDHEGYKYLRHAYNEYRVLRAIQEEGAGDPPEGIVRMHRRVSKKFLRKKKEHILVMDYVDGFDLRRENRFPLGQIVDFLTQVARALFGLHARGYIHGDLKPENIVVSHHGHAKLVDFGFACKTGSLARSIRGTRDYMAPEQLNMGHLTEKTDLYNFGATMYFLLTGRHVPAMIAAQGDNAHFIAARHTRVTPLREINPAIPAGLERTVLLCLEKEPIARPSCVEEVLAHLLATRDLFVS